MRAMCIRDWPNSSVTATAWCQPGASGDLAPGASARPSASDLSPSDADRYLVRDAQRVTEGIESLVRIHNAQEEDIYEHAAMA